MPPLTIPSLSQSDWDLPGPLLRFSMQLPSLVKRLSTLVFWDQPFWKHRVNMEASPTLQGECATSCQTMLHWSPCPALSHFPEFPGSADPEGERSGKREAFDVSKAPGKHIFFYYIGDIKCIITAYFIIWFEYCILLFVSHCQSQDSEMPFHLTFSDKFQRKLFRHVFSLKKHCRQALTVYITNVTSIQIHPVLSYTGLFLP